MKPARFLSAASAALLLVALAAAPAWVAAQQTQQASTATTASAPAGLDVERIIRTFVGKEVEFRRALTQYGFKRDAVLQTIGMGGQISGEFRRVSNFTFDDSGRRYERITFAPMSSIKEIEITP